MRLFWWGSLSLLSGLLYYAVFRFGATPLMDLSEGAYPSFAFVLAFSLLSTSLWRGSGGYRFIPAIAWLMVVLVTELFFGTIHGFDVVAALVGFVLALAVIQRAPVRALRVRAATGKSTLMAAAGLLFLAGSYYPYEYCEHCGCEDCSTAILMPYSELRSAVRLEAPREMKEMKGLYLYGDRIFMTEKGKGVHIINNADATNPAVEGFINVPGNTNVSIRNGFMFVDSFVDLVVLDVRDTSNVFEVSRQIDVFPYDAHQAIDFEGYLLGVDELAGVVIGYED